jgi:hypothetical protein
MDYTKFRFKSSLIGDAVSYIESRDGRPMRQITVKGDVAIASNIYYPKWGLMLSDQDTCLETEEHSSREEFDLFWAPHLSRNLGRWCVTKLAHPVGSQVEGAVVIFYPQGPILDIGSAVLGVVGSKLDFELNQRVLSIVAGHDEQNQWLVLDPL